MVRHEGDGLLDPETLFVTRPERRIGHAMTSHGPLVVLTPGMGDLRSTCRFLAPALIAAGFRVASVDLIRGDSDVPPVPWSWLDGIGHATGCCWCSISYSIGVSIPIELRRRWRLWKISR